MARPLFNDLRERAMARVAAGEPIRQIAAALAIKPFLRIEVVAAAADHWERRAWQDGRP